MMLTGFLEAVLGWRLGTSNIIGCMTYGCVGITAVSHSFESSHGQTNQSRT